LMISRQWDSLMLRSWKVKLDVVNKLEKKRVQDC
jgi:hypothetical protein